MDRCKGKKKVLFLTYGFPIGGAETFLINLLTHINISIFKPIVISLSETVGLDKTLKNDIEIIRCPRKWKYDLQPALKIANIIQEQQVESIFVNGLFSYFFLKCALKKIKNPTKVLISLHSTAPRSVKDYLLNFFYARLLNGKELLITVCHNQSNYISRKYFIPKNRFITIYNGVETDHWTLPPEEFNKKEFRLNWAVPEDVFVIIQVAAFRKEKKQKDSIRALHYIHSNYNIKPYLILVGGGNLTIEEDVKRLTQRLGLAEFVKFCGVQKDVRPFYWSSDLFTLSSVSIETFSIAALEALSTGLPCVITDLGGANEMVTNGHNGYIVPKMSPVSLAEGWKKVIDGKIERDRLNIRQHIVNNFSLSRTIHSYEKILGSLND